MAIGRYQVWVQGMDQRNADGVEPFDYHRNQYASSVDHAEFNDAVAQQPTISWNALSGETRYDIWFDNATTGTSQVIRNTNVLTTSYTPPAPLNFGAYRVWVEDWISPEIRVIGRPSCR